MWSYGIHMESMGEGKEVQEENRGKCGLYKFICFLSLLSSITYLVEKLQDAKNEIQGMPFTFKSHCTTIKFNTRIEERNERRYLYILEYQASCRCVFLSLFLYLLI
jgi:hypothetical protein